MVGGKKKAADSSGEIKTVRIQIQPVQRGAPSSPRSLSGGMSPLSAAGVTLGVLLILNIPTCTSAPANLHQATTDQTQILRQLDAVCSSYLLADLRYLTTDVLGELCVLMLFQGSKEPRVPENIKRTSRLHPLLHLVSQLHTRREREVLMHAELQGPGGIESRGYFLYRPRNGRRSLQYE